MDFSDFKELEFPPTSDIVYILYFRRPDDNSEVPFYVGVSSRHIGRIGDYVSAKYSAQTDYKVGEAIKLMRSSGLYIGIKYKETMNRKKEEREIINKLGEDYLLLNVLKGYDYKKSNKEQDKNKIHEFVQKIINKIYTTRNDNKNSENTNRNKNSTLRKSEVSVDENNMTRTGRLITGSVTRQGTYADNKDICELIISKESSDKLPHSPGEEKQINLSIGDIVYEAGVHETQAGLVWISSVLFKNNPERVKVRLVDALEKIGLAKGDKISINTSSEDIFILIKL